MGSIEIPAPVFELFSTQTSTQPDYHEIFEVEIRVGEVVLIERRFTDDYNTEGTGVYARDKAEAEEMTLNAFGEKLKEFLK